MLIKLAQDRVKRSDIINAEEGILRLIVQMKDPLPGAIAKEFGKTPQYVGRLISTLVDKDLAITRVSGREKRYFPKLDAIIAYQD